MLSVSATDEVRLTVDVPSPEWMQLELLEVFSHAPGREATNGQSNGTWPDERASQPPSDDSRQLRNGRCHRHGVPPKDPSARAGGDETHRKAGVVHRRVSSQGSAPLHAKLQSVARTVPVLGEAAWVDGCGASS
jgi:hypothetical protein